MKLVVLILTSGTKTITVSYSGKTETFDITVNEPVTPPTPSKTLSSIAVTTNPTKTEYTVGEELDKTGMVITATYSDASEETIDNSLVTTDFDSSVAAESKTVTVTYEGKTATFTVKIVAAPVVHADHIIFYKKGSADWVELALVENNDHEYKLNEEIHFDVGDKFVFHMTGDDWRRYSDIKDGGAKAKFEADSDDNFVVLMAGDYQFYVDTNGSAPSVYTVRNNIPVSLEAAYGNEYAFVNGTIDGSKVDVHYVYDDGSKGVNIANNAIFYILIETAPDTYTPYEVSDQTVIAESMLGTMRVYASLETDIANVNPTNDPYFDVQIIYKNYVHHQVGQNFVDTPLTEDYFEHKCAIIELAEDAKFAVRTNGIWTSGLVGDYSGQGYYDQSGDLYRDDYTSIWQGSSDLEKVVDFPYDVTWKATIAGKYVIGVHEDSWGVIAYRLNWTVTLTRASDPLNPEVLDPTNFIFREYQFERLDLAEGDVLTIERIYDKEGHSIKYGYDYVSDPNSVFEKFSKGGAIDYFAPYDGTNSFVVKAGCGGIYSFYLKHEMVYYSKPGQGHSATYSPSIYIVKEDIWHYTKGATDEEMPYDPYDSTNKVILANVDLEVGDEIGFYNAVMADIGYSNIADDGQRAHFTEGANNKLVVKDGEAGAYTFHIVRSTGAITVDYTSEADQYNFVKNKYYVVGSADYSSGTSVDGASWNDASIAFLMVADDEHKPEEYNHQFKATVKFNENDEWKVRTNIYMPYNLENAGALENNVYMEVQNGNLKVNRTGTYDIYFKMKDDGYCSMYISKAIDFTVDKSSVTVGVGETKNVAVSYSDGRDFTADLEATSAKDTIATANAQYSLKQVAITGVAVGETTVTITDGRTSQVVNVIVTAQPMPASGFGIQYLDHSFKAATDEGEHGGFHEYKIENVHLEVGDKFNLVDFSTGNRWLVNIDEASFGNAVATYLDKGAEYYEVLTDCYVDIYIKIKQDSDQIYFGLYDIMLNGVRDNANVAMEVGDEAFVNATMWSGTLAATVTDGADKVEIVSVNQENGKITFRGLANGSATITVSANGFERTINVTVSLAAKAYITGINNDWTAGQEAYKMTKVGDGHYQITGVEIQQGDKIKVVYTADDGANYTWYGNASTWQAVEDIISREENGNVVFLQDGTYTIDFYVSADGDNHIAPTRTGGLTSLYVDSLEVLVEAGNTVEITATHFIGTLSAVSDDLAKATIASVNQETGVITVNGVADGAAHITVSATGNANTKVVTVTVAPITMVTITFTINYGTNYGQSLKLVFAPGWNVAEGYALTWTEGNNWTVSVTLVQGTTLTYKFVVVQDGQSDIWEGGNDRTTVFDADDSIVCNWQ